MPGPASSPLSYQRIEDWQRRRLLVGPSSVPMAAFIVAIVHATGATVLAVATAVAAKPANGREYEPLSFMLGLQLPTGGAALLLGILGHRYVDGRKLAGPAMWIVGIVPGASCVLHLLVAAIARHSTGVGSLIAAFVIVIDVIIVLALRNRILKTPQGPLPVIPILEGQDWQPPGRQP
jgi:hypothetical protein